MRITIATFALAATFAATAAGQTAKLADLGWMSGCWEMTNPKNGARITEMWMRPDGNAMLGVGRTMRDGKLTDYEFLRIVEEENKLSYISRPSGNKDDTPFGLIRSSANELVFENAAHDFPQRIIYRREGEKLKARIEGTINGKSRGVDFSYTRAKCE